MLLQTFSAVRQSISHLGSAKLKRQVQNPVEMVGLAFHCQPRTAMERRPYRVLQLPHNIKNFDEPNEMSPQERRLREVSLPCWKGIYET